MLINQRKSDIIVEMIEIKDMFAVQCKKKDANKQNPIKITRSYVNEKPAPEEIHQLQNEVQHLLLSCLSQHTSFQ